MTPVRTMAMRMPLARIGLLSGGTQKVGIRSAAPFIASRALRTRAGAALPSKLACTSLVPIRRALSTPSTTTPLEPTPSILSRVRSFSQPYIALARMTRPIGSWLLFWPCAFSIALGAHHLALPVSTALWYTGLFGVGAVVMRGAGCTINDLWDRDLDAGVERTKSRPLASGAVTPFRAMTFLGIQLSAGLAVLMQLNWYSIALGASSLSLVVIYPLMKRITNWPQLVLGLAFNWGALLGYASLSGSLYAPIVAPLYLGTISWCVAYDTIYAHQDKVDDAQVGIGSSAQWLGDKWTKPALVALNSVFIAGTAAAAAAVSAPVGVTGWAALSLAAHPATCAALGAAVGHLGWQIKDVNLDDRQDCWDKFESNRDVGFIVWLGIMIDYVAAMYGWFGL